MGRTVKITDSSRYRYFFKSKNLKDLLKNEPKAKKLKKFKMTLMKWKFCNRGKNNKRPIIDIDVEKYSIKKCDFEVNENQRDITTYADISPCLLYTSPSPRDLSTSRMPSSA